MKSIFARIIGALIMLSGGGCASVPLMALNADPNSPAPAGPKVAAIFAHLKCELREAANSDIPLPYYEDDPALRLRRLKEKPDQDRAFTLQHLFAEIEYVAQVQLILDVTGTGSINPSLSFITPYTTVSNFTGSVSGQFNESTHRSLTLATSVDFNRLVESEINPLYRQIGKIQNDPRVVVPSVVPCDATGSKAGSEIVGGPELGGRLGLRESISEAIIPISMNDVGVLPVGQKAIKNNGASRAGASGTLRNGATSGYSAPLNNDNTFGIQVDFTVIEGINGGPNYTLTTFKGPGGGAGAGGTNGAANGTGSGGGSQNLLNFNRLVKDTLIITFVPVCIRHHYFPLSHGPEYEYTPKLMVGTPAWANFLPPCAILSDENVARSNALSRATNYNTLIQINRLAAPR